MAGDNFQEGVRSGVLLGLTDLATTDENHPSRWDGCFRGGPGMMRGWRIVSIAAVAIAMAACGAEVKVDGESGDVSVKAPGGVAVQVKGDDNGGKVSVKAPGVEVKVAGDDEGGKVSVKAPGVDVQVKGADEGGGDVAVKAAGVNVKVKGDADGKGDVTITTSGAKNTAAEGKDDDAEGAGEKRSDEE